jgi:proteic killer suppression protein
MPIGSFKDQGTNDIAQRVDSKIARRKLAASLHEAAYRKLVFLDNAHSLRDLANWKGLHLEKLMGNRKEQYSIRINNRYRICFKWTGSDAVDVEIVDYH